MNTQPSSTDGSSDDDGGVPLNDPGLHSDLNSNDGFEVFAFLRKLGTMREGEAETLACDTSDAASCGSLKDEEYESKEKGQYLRDIRIEDRGMVVLHSLNPRATPYQPLPPQFEKTTTGMPGVRCVSCSVDRTHYCIM
jgi:hypothetical protein